MESAEVVRVVNPATLLPRHIQPSGFSIEEALNALRPLMKVRSGEAKVRFACSDSTGLKLCRTNYDTAGTGEASYMGGHQKGR